MQRQGLQVAQVDKPEELTSRCALLPRLRGAVHSQFVNHNPTGHPGQAGPEVFL